MRAASDALEQMGNLGHWVTVAVGLADAILAQGRIEEAVRLTERIAEGRSPTTWTRKSAGAA